MKLIEYIGDPANGGEGPEVTTMQGVLFERGRPVETNDPALIAKAEGNSHFNVTVKRGRKVKADDADGE